jgi:DNA (cytosine-5)-methyltransferase 1
MPRILSFSALGTAHNAPRFWIEGARLGALGFEAGTPIDVRTVPNGLTIAPAVLGEHVVSSRRAAGSARPIIDVNSHRLLSHLADFRDIKVAGSFGRLEVTPTVRAFAIAGQLRRTAPLEVLDVFGGGGTLSDGFAGNEAFRVRACVELEPNYADEFARKHPEADLILGDFRSMSPEELPPFQVLVAGIPCSEHSNQGRAKKGLAGRPELGELGDLYVHVLALVAARMPLACVFENVPLFGSSLAGATMVANLRRLGYHVAETVVEANTQWGEPSTRNRWVCVATLQPGFQVTAPGVPFAGTVGEYFDAVDPVRDRADAERIAVTVAGLRTHNARHAAKGNGFSMTVLDGTERAAPVICKSYHKINSSGFFIATPWGPRMARKHEIERLHGQRITCGHYATAVEMMGQGVLTRVFTQIFRQLGEFLAR